MSKILSSGDIEGTILNDVSLYTLDTINIGQYSAKALRGIENVIIGKNAGRIGLNVNKSIYIGSEACEYVFSGNNNISIGSDYANTNNINNILSIGYSKTLNNNSITLGNDNSNIHDINIGFCNNGMVLMDSELIIKNLVVSDNEINLGFFNFGVSNLNIGNNNSNNNGINIGSFNTSTVNNSVIIGNNIENSNFSLNIDNFICKYRQNDGSNIIYLGIGFYENIPIIIGSSNNTDIKQNNGLIINGTVDSDIITLNNINNNSIKLKINSNINKNYTYTFTKNSNNTFLNPDSNGNLNWIDKQNSEINNIYTTGDIIAQNILCDNFTGKANFIINVNFDGNTSDFLKEGIKNLYYKKDVFNDIFNSNLDLITTDYINVGKNSNNFYFSNKLFKKYLEKNLELITTDYITNGTSNKYLTINDFDNESMEYFKNKTTDELNEKNVNKYFNDSNFNLNVNNLFASNAIIDKIIEGSNLFYTDNRYFKSLNNYISIITTDDINKGIINIFDNSNITLSNINSKFTNSTTDTIKEGTSNKYITLGRINDIIDSNLNTTDKIAPTSNFRYYNISNQVQLNSDLIAKNLNMVYYDSNTLLQNISCNITTDNFIQGTEKSLFINETKISQVFTSIFSNNITADNIKTKTRSKFIQNNNYNNDIFINGDCKAYNVNNIDLNLLLKSQEPTIGELTKVAFNYEVNNITLNTPYNNLDIKYNYQYVSNLNNTCNSGVPFIVINENVGINNINPNYNLDVIGTAKSDYFKGDGSQIINLLWNNISFKPFNNINLTYFKVLNNELSIKQIEATNNNIPVIYNNLNILQYPLQIENTFNYYYIFTEGINNIQFFDDTVCDVFMIGGGGGGGGYYGGGGGAGSYFIGTLNFSKNLIYNINVGGGGIGANPSSLFEGTRGGNTSITFNENILRSVNGGGCGDSGFLNINLNINGGCGGGGKGYQINNIENANITFLGGFNTNSESNIGFNGGYGYYYTTTDTTLNKFCGGGGGGAGSQGYNVTNINNIMVAGAGGNGIIINLTGSNMVFGGGGGGSSDNTLNTGIGYGGSFINSSLNIKCGGDGSGDLTNPNGKNGIKMGSGGGGGCGINGCGGNGIGGCVIIKFNLINYAKFKAEYDNEILPSYTWKNNINTGMYYNNNILGFSINCNTKLKIDNGVIYGDGYGLSNIKWNNLINIPSSISSIFESGGSLNTIFISSNVFTSVLSGYLAKTDSIISPWVKNVGNIYYDNNVGIGNPLPSEKLDIVGNVKIGNAQFKNFLLFNPGNTSSNDIGYISFFNNNIEVGGIGKRENTNILLNCFNGITGYKLNGNLFVANSGKIGIGISSPIFSLEVNGISKITKQLINTNTSNTNDALTLTPLTVNNIVINRSGFNHLFNGAVSTFTNSNANNILNDNYPIIHLCRDGYNTNYGLKSTLCLSRWENNDINSRTKLNFLLSHNTYNNENNVLSLYSDGVVKILNKVIIGDSNLGNLELTGTGSANKYNILVSLSNDLIFKNNVNDIISINNNGINGLKDNLNLSNLFINWSNIKSLPLLLESNSLQNILTLDSFNSLVESNKTNFLIKSEASNYYLAKNEAWQFLMNSGLNQVNINRIIQNDAGGFYFNNINTFAIGTDVIKDYNKKFIINGDILIDNGNIFINNTNTKPLIKINDILKPLNEYNDYYYYRFFNTTTNTLILNDYIACDIIIVGGGGNGAIGNGGGGGGGEVIYLQDIILNTGTYNLYVGNYGENSYISDINNNKIYIADAGGNGGYLNRTINSIVNATSGGSGGGAYLTSVNGGKTPTDVNSYGNIGGYGSSTYSGGGGGAGSSSSRNIGGSGFITELNGAIISLGEGGNGYINSGYVIKSIIENTGMGGSSSSELAKHTGSAGTIIIKIKRSFNINNLFVSSNNFLSSMNNFGSITSNVLKNIISDFPTSNNLKYLLNDTLWTNKADNTGIYINNNVGIGGIPLINNDKLQVFGNAYLNTISTSEITINNKHIDNIFVSSNVFPLLNNSYGTINSNVLTNVLSKYLNECNVISIIKPSQWDNLDSNYIIYNNNVIANRLFYNNNLPSIQFNKTNYGLITMQYTKILNTNEQYFIFNDTSGTYLLNIFNSHNLCDILVVGGGGIGGVGNLSGGGGAGEVIYIQKYIFNSGNYTINVGKNREDTLIKKIIDGTSNTIFKANAGGNGSSAKNSIYSIIPFLNPWAIYSAADSDNTYLYDMSGNERHAILSGSGFSYTIFNNNVYTLNGTTASTVTFPTGSIPNLFTYLIIAKYNGSAKNTLLKGQNNSNSFFGFKDGNIGYSSLNQYDTDGTPNLTNMSSYITFRDANIGYSDLYYIFIKNDLSQSLANIKINGVNIGRNIGLYGQETDNLIINNCDWSLANLFIWNSNLSNDDIDTIYNNICKKHINDKLSIVKEIYEKNTNATSGGSGGGGIVNSIGASYGIPWKINNTNISYLNSGNKGSVRFGGGGGGAGGTANLNIGGAAKAINITGNTIYVGKGGNGGSNISTTIPENKVLYGDGGDSGTTIGYGASGVVIIKFYEYADLDNFYITDNTISEVALANNIINSNVLQNYLDSGKFITSNVFLNLVSNNNIINSNNLTPFISSNVLFEQKYINSNFIQNSLSADFIKNGISNNFIVNNSYSNDITFTKNVFTSNLITSNLFVIDKYSIFNTTVYETEQLQVVNNTTAPALIIKQIGLNQNVAEFYNLDNPSLIINNLGNVSIGINSSSDIPYKLFVNGSLNANSIYNNGILLSTSLSLKQNLLNSSTVLYGNGSNITNLIYNNIQDKPIQWITSEKNLYYNTGYIGIGTNSPSNLLHIHSNFTNSCVKIQLTDNTTGVNSNSGFIISKESNQDVRIINYSSGTICLGINNSNSIFISSNGSVGIGTTGIFGGTGCLTVGTEIRCIGDISGFYSDMRLKTKVSNIINPFNIINNITGFKYIANDLAIQYGLVNIKDKNKNFVGVSAQEVNEVLPEIVSLAPFDIANDSDGNLISKSGHNYLTIKYDKLVPVLIEGLKELKKEVLFNKLNSCYDYIPNIYKFCQCSGNIIKTIINISNIIKINDKIKIISSNLNKYFIVINIIDNYTFSVNEDFNNNFVFVYGTFINNVNEIDNKCLLKLVDNTSDEIYSIMNNFQEKIYNLEKKIDEINNKIK